MVRVASGAGSIEVLTSRTGIRGAVVGDRFVPTDAQGRAYPYFTPADEDRYISAADILDGTYDVAQLRGAAVFLGVTSEGLENKRETPAGLMPAIEVHAQLYESIESGNLLRRPVVVSVIEIALTIAIGLLIIFALPYRRPSIALTLVTVAVLSLVGCEFISFRFFRLLIDTLYPALSGLVVFLFMLGSNLRSAEAERRVLSSDLEHERQMEARMEGELKAASAIQMGLLPRRFPGPPQQRDVEVYALLEPAREVGGDLYDFLFLDSGHLAFVIADVAGKGVPAALFMAMTREVIRAALQREGQELDLVFAEANAKISTTSEDMAADGADMMFVTVFAGVLDLETGELFFANAGHEEPLVLRQGSVPAGLKGDSGPPLGALEDFSYRVERWQMMPGEMLLLYTDGVTEAQNSSRLFYGENRLKRAVADRFAGASAKAVVELVRQDVRRFAGTEQADDLTLLAVRWLGPSSAL
jgi:serine phosphatase RsbU (regulator of sigma subunit)